MSKPYFRYVPNFGYISRNKDEKQLSEYIVVKNLFKRAKLFDDIIENLAYFEKYTIIPGERPDNVAYKFYDNSDLDWVILLSNNILDVKSEWPVSQQTFDNQMLEKYDSYEKLYSGIHHYESVEVKDSQGKILIPSGLTVPENFFFEYYDKGVYKTVSGNKIRVEVTNYDYEVRLNERKKNIYVLKAEYLNVVFNDMDNIMPYKKGSQQYISENLKKGDNIRLYE